MLKRMFSLGSVVMALTIMGLAGNAQATVIDFEGLDPGYETSGIWVPPGYGGFTWSQDTFGITDQYLPGTGYEYGTIGDVSIYGGWASDVSMTSTFGPFNFNGAFITAAWNIGETVTVEGWSGGSLAYTQDIVTSYDGPYWWDFNFLNVDELWFRSLPEDGTNAGLGGAGAHIAIDNITYNEEIPPTPEPGTLLLLGPGLAGLALWWRRRSKKS